MSIVRHAFTSARAAEAVRLALGACAIVAFAFAAAAQTGCPSPDHREALDPSTLPPEVRADYEVFAQRCSKCHSLSRPLNSGIVDDEYWALYVARMRRQPASGISPEDAHVILRFLHYYSLDQIQKKEARKMETSGAATPGPPPAPASSPPETSPSAAPSIGARSTSDAGTVDAG